MQQLEALLCQPLPRRQPSADAELGTTLAAARSRLLTLLCLILCIHVRLRYRAERVVGRGIRVLCAAGPPLGLVGGLEPLARAPDALLQLRLGLRLRLRLRLGRRQRDDGGILGPPERALRRRATPREVSLPRGRCGYPAAAATTAARRHHTHAFHRSDPSLIHSYRLLICSSTNYGFIICTQVRMTKLLVMLEYRYSYLLSS